MVWSQCCYSCNQSVSAKAVQLMVQLVIQTWKREKLSLLSDLSQEAALAVQSLILTLCSSTRPAEKELKMALSSAVHLSRVSNNDVSTAIVGCLIQLVPYSTGNELVVCEWFNDLPH